MSKKKAHAALTAAIKARKLKPVKAYLCSTDGCYVRATDWHHYKGYAPEHYLTVIALCRSHHRLAHEAMKR